MRSWLLWLVLLPFCIVCDTHGHRASGKHALARLLFHLPTYRPQLQLRRPVPAPRARRPVGRFWASRDAKSLRFAGEIRKNVPWLDRNIELLSRQPQQLRLLEQSYQELLDAAGHLEIDGTEDAGDRVRCALEVAFLAHLRQKRKSGEPFVIHPVQVAKILAQAQMDRDSVISGLLHDTVEDTDLSFENVEEMFGHAVRNIVQGDTAVTKIPDAMATKLGVGGEGDAEQLKEKQFDIGNPVAGDAEDLRGLLMAMGSDPRIIIVKLADRLHNMRTLEHMPKKKQEKKSKETLEYYVPLAGRLGLWNFKTELSDLCFKYLKPEEDERIANYTEGKEEAYEGAVRKIYELLNTLRDESSEGEAGSLIKSASVQRKDRYNIWLKMQRRNCTVDQIDDLVAVRLILGSNDTVACYALYSRLRKIMTPINRTFKDYIKDPKQNGYQSLHVTMQVNGLPVELQIRTEKMNEVAEFSVGTDWDYGDAVANKAWKELFANIKQINDETSSAMEFVRLVNNNLTSDYVFVRYLNNGSTLQFPKGTTLQDFAQELKVTNSQRVLVNGATRGCSMKLRNNDHLKIQSSASAPDFFAYVATTIASLRSASRDVETKNFEICRDCNPLPGDELIGTESSNGQRQLRLLHRKDCHCPTLERVKRDIKETTFGDVQTTHKVKHRYYDFRVSKKLQKELRRALKKAGYERYPSTFVAFAKDRDGLLDDILSASRSQSNRIVALSPEVLGENAAVEIEVDVKSKKDLSKFMRAVKPVQGVRQVKRGSIRQLIFKSRASFWKSCESTRAEKK